METNLPTIWDVPIKVIIVQYLHHLFKFGNEFSCLCSVVLDSGEKNACVVCVTDEEDTEC